MRESTFFNSSNRELLKDEAYIFKGDWTFIEKKEFIDFLDNYNLVEMMLTDDEAALEDNLSDDQYAESLKFIFKKEDNNYFLSFGNKLLKSSENRDNFFFKLKIYFKSITHAVSTIPHNNHCKN